MNLSAPPGLPKDLEGGELFRLRDGQIIEHRLSMDQLSFMQRFGVMPSED